MTNQVSGDKKTAIFYGGTNGSGKTTLRNISSGEIELNIDPDAEARKINPNNPRSADMAAGRKALQLFDDALSVDLSFSMESTLTGKSILKRMQKASDQGYHVELRYVGLSSADLNVQRVHERVAKGGHHIDDDVVRKRYQESRNNLSEAIRIADVVVIWDNSQDKIMECARITGGVVEYVEGIEIQNWVVSVINENEKTSTKSSDMPTILHIVNMSKTSGIAAEAPNPDDFDMKLGKIDKDSLEP